MSVENRVLEYHKTSPTIQIEHKVSHSDDGACAIFSISTKDNTQIGTLRVVTIYDQHQLSTICNKLDTILNVTLSENHFLSPVKLDTQELQKEVEKMQSLEYVLPKMTYKLYNWKENEKSGTDLYIYQLECEKVKLDLNEVEVQEVKKNSITDSSSLNISESTVAVTQISKKQPTGILMKGTYESNNIFGKAIPKSTITQIVFSDTLENLPNDSWDVSEQQNGSVMAWIKDGVLHICGDGGIIANPDSSWLFANYINVTAIDFENCFDTKNVTDMSWMFFDCSSLVQLDFSNFDTKNVTSMREMFYDCWALTTLDLSRFDTKNVTSMSSMFFNCKALTTLDLSNFDTKNVTNIRGMFCACSALTKLDLSNFDTKNVTDMSWMFEGCSNDIKTHNGLKKNRLFNLF